VWQHILSTELTLKLFLDFFLISILTPLIKVSVHILPSNYAILCLFSSVNYVNCVAVKNKNKLNFFCSYKRFELFYGEAYLTPCGTAYLGGWFNLPQRWGKLSNQNDQF